MRFSIATTALCGATAVSALSIRRGAQHVDLAPFEAGKFETIPPPAKANTSSKTDAVAGPVADTPSSNAAAAGGCSNPGVRIEWRNLADSDKAAFVAATQCLLNRPSGGTFQGSQNRYEDLVSVHQQMTPNIHMVGQFLPWHRYFLAIYESLLRVECGYTGPMTWWDETLDAGNFANSPIFTDAYYGEAPLITSDGQGTCVSTGAFAGLTLHIGPGDGYTDHCLSRALDESLTAQCNADFVNSCNSNANYGDFEPCTEMGPHAYGHNGIGSVMSDVAPSPGDPVFFMHHGFVDHSWWLWQNADPANRLYQVGGFTTTTQPQQPLTLDYVLTSLGLRDDLTVDLMMDTVGGYLCYTYDY